MEDKFMKSSPSKMQEMFHFEMATEFWHLLFNSAENFQMYRLTVQIYFIFFFNY